MSGEILGSHNKVAEDSVLLGWEAVSTGEKLPTSESSNQSMVSFFFNRWL